MTTRVRIAIAAALCAGISLGSCQEETKTTDETTVRADSPAVVSSDPKSLKPAGSDPEWGPDMDDEMLVLIEKLQSYNAPPIETLSPAEARKQPTLTNAVMDVAAEHNIPMPAPLVDTMGKEIPVAGGSIHARVYTPKTTLTGPKPGIMYFHGGGWVIADINVYNSSAQAMAEQTGAVVVSVEYRKGPEAKFPAAHNDAFAAWKWMLAHAGELGIDSSKVAVAGESAGGNLACNVSIMARDARVMLPKHQVLVYPVAQNDTTTASYTKYAMAKPLNRSMINWFLKHYLANPAQSNDPRMSLVKANLKGLPPTTIINAGLDVLLDDGQMLGDKLQAAGVTVSRKVYDGVTHEFFGAALLLPDAKAAQAQAFSALKTALQ